MCVFIYSTTKPFQRAKKKLFETIWKAFSHAKCRYNQFYKIQSYCIETITGDHFIIIWMVRVFFYYFWVCYKDIEQHAFFMHFDSKCWSLIYAIKLKKGHSYKVNHLNEIWDQISQWILKCKWEKAAPANRVEAAETSFNRYDNRCWFLFRWEFAANAYI